MSLCSLEVLYKVSACQFVVNLDNPLQRYEFCNIYHTNSKMAAISMVTNCYKKRKKIV